MNFSSFLQGYQDFKKTLGLVRTGVPLADFKKSYASLPNLAGYLPWMDYDPDAQAVILEDGHSMAGFLRLSDIPAAALSLNELETLRDEIAFLFQGVIPFESDEPWHVQFYLEDDYSLEESLNMFDQRIRPGCREHPFTQAYRDCLAEHFRYLSQSGGLFTDHSLTGHIFRGKKRNITLCIYRHLNKKNTEEAGKLNQVLTGVMAHFSGLGACVERMKGEEIWSWLSLWFNPKKGLERCMPPIEKPGEQPYGFDWSEQLFLSHPHSHAEQGVWYFDQEPHQFLSIDALSQIPSIGHMTRASKQGRYFSGLFDHLPEHTRFMMTFVMVHPDDITKKIGRVRKSCVGDHAESQLTRESCDQALVQHEEGNRLLPCSMGFYIRAPDYQALQEKNAAISSRMIQHGFRVIHQDSEIYPLHAYLRYLPANYHYALEGKVHRSRLIYARQIANLLPLYGQYKASGKMCLSYWTRSGESFSFDPFDSKDKAANSHLLFLAETGGGKSAALVYHLMHVIAMYQPRVFIIEAGDSFKLLCDYAAGRGLTVNQVKLSLDNPSSLNPFAGLLEHVSIENSSSGRDYLGEMTLAAHLMVTGGDPKEEAKMTRADEAVLLKSVARAGESARCSGCAEVLTQDVVAALFELATSEPNLQRAARIQEMGEAMSHFVLHPFSSSFFNRAGSPWPSVDLTRLDLGLMKEAQYSAQLAISVITMLSRILNSAEQEQYSDRMTLVLMDEAHLLTKNPLTAQHITQFSKMCRKLGMWLWLATQNIADFPEESKKMLSMIEFWIGLGTSEQEIDEIRRYKQMSDEEKALFLSLRKEIPHYVEGVVLSRKIKGLFRNIPPRLALTLGMSEQSEKAIRKKIMQSEGCSEVEAAIHMANKLLKGESLC